jgi:hypothetical protein
MVPIFAFMFSSLSHRRSMAMLADLGHCMVALCRRVVPQGIRQVNEKQ